MCESGSMDRLMDGTYGYEALNATHHYMPNKMLLGTEVCTQRNEYDSNNALSVVVVLAMKVV